MMFDIDLGRVFIRKDRDRAVIVLVQTAFPQVALKINAKSGPVFALCQNGDGPDQLLISLHFISRIREPNR